MKRILFVHNYPQPFVRIDLALLRERWTVDERYEQSPKRINPLAIFNAVRRADLVFCWFASWHSLFPALFARLLGKPCIVVVGGYDTANVPEAGYGSQRGGMRRRIVQAIVRASTHFITNSESAKREAMTNAGIPVEKITVIYHGVDPIPAGEAEREKIALTVGGVWRENLRRKGLLPFVEAAAHLPDWTFVVVGKWYDGIDELKAASGANVELTGFLDDAALADWYRRASVYVQASLHEGFGMSMAEAMSAGCIPVVTNVGAIPEVVGDCGIYVEPTPEAIAAGIAQAHGGSFDRDTIRNRMVTEFSMERRRTSLHILVKNMLL